MDLRVEDLGAEAPVNFVAGWTTSFVARITGELVARSSGWHTIWVVGGPMTRLSIDGVVKGATFTANTVETEYNTTSKEHVVVGTRFPEGSTRVYLTAGAPVSLKVEYVNSGISGPNKLSLEWSRGDHARTVIPESAFQHRPRAMCLSYFNGDQRAHTMECDEQAPEQLFRVDGGFIRPAARSIQVAAPCAPVLPHSQRKIHTKGNIWSFTVG